MSLSQNFAAVALGGSAGACARYALSLLIPQDAARFPFATLLANLSGALLAGMVVSVLISRGQSGSSLQLLAVTGFLGSYTTLSAFSLETLRLAQNGSVMAATVNVIVTVAGALIAVLIGTWIGKLI